MGEGTIMYSSISNKPAASPEKYKRLIYVGNLTASFRSNGVVEDLQSEASKIEHEYSNSTDDQTIIASLYYVRLILSCLHKKLNYKSNSLAENLTWLWEATDHYLYILNYCSDYIEIIDYINLHKVWEDVASVVPLICENNVGINFRSKNPRHTQESILKFICDYIDNGFYIQTGTVTTTPIFKTSFGELQKQLDRLNISRSTIEASENARTLKHKFLLNTTEAELQIRIQLIHTFCLMYPETQLPELIKSSHKLHCEYIPYLNQENLNDYCDEISALCSKVLKTKHTPILQQYFIDLKHQIERAIVSRGTTAGYAAKFKY